MYTAYSIAQFPFTICPSNISFSTAKYLPETNYLPFDPLDFKVDCIIVFTAGHFGEETAVILLDDNELKYKVKRILVAGGATVKGLTVKHLVDNFDQDIDFVITDPDLFENKDPETNIYQQLVDICRDHEVPMVSVAYVEMCLTSAVRPSKSLFSVLRDEIIQWNIQVLICWPQSWLAS